MLKFNFSIILNLSYFYIIKCRLFEFKNYLVGFKGKKLEFIYYKNLKKKWCRLFETSEIEFTWIYVNMFIYKRNV